MNFSREFIFTNKRPSKVKSIKDIFLYKKTYNSREFNFTISDTIFYSAGAVL